MAQRTRIGELLIESRALTSEKLEEALAAQLQHGGRLGTHLVERGFVDAQQMSTMLAHQLKVPTVESERLVHIPKATLSRLPAKDAERLRAVPFRWREQGLDVVMVDPCDESALEALATCTGLSIQPFIAPEAIVTRALDHHYGIRPYEEAAAGVRETDADLTPPEGTQVPPEVLMPLGGAGGASATPRPLFPASLPHRPGVGQRIGAPPTLRHRMIPRTAVDTVSPTLSGMAGADLSPPHLILVVNELGRASKLRDVLDAVIQYTQTYFEKSFIFRVQRTSCTLFLARCPHPVQRAVDAVTLTMKQCTPFELVGSPVPFYLGPLPKGAEEDALAEALGEPQEAPLLMLPLVRLESHELVLLGAGPRPSFSPESIRHFSMVVEKARLALHIQQLRRRLQFISPDRV